MIICENFCVKSSASPPSRGAWIEISKTESITVLGSVAPLAGGVD